MYGIISIYGFSATPDEFGYWSPAAAILGYDWSGITGLGSFYSYGYSVLLIPILFIFHGGTIAYRAAVVLNLVLQLIALFVLYLILGELYPGETKQVRSVAATMAVLYPAWAFYVNTTMVEALLNFALVLSIYLALRFFKNPSVLSGSFFALILIYLYLVHMRCIGTIGAGGITIFLWLLSRKKDSGKKHFKSWILLVVLILLFAVSFVLKDKVVSVLYHNTSDEVLSWNDYSGILYRLRKIISLKGLGYLFKDICGKVLYMGLATFGIAYFGIIGCIRRLSSSVKVIKAKEASYIDLLWIYISLIVVFQFMVALIYLNGASAPEADRLDNFLHGRYIDFFLPILIAIGVEEMLRGGKLFGIFEGSFLLILPLALICLHVIYENNTHMHNAHGFTMIGMSFFLTKPLSDTMDYYFKQFILSVALMLAADIIIIAARRFKQDIIINLLLVMQIVMGIQACGHYIFDIQPYVASGIIMGDKIKEVVEEYPERKLLHVYEGGAVFIEIVQFCNPDMDIDVINGEFTDIDITQYLDNDTILVLTGGQDYEYLADEFYEEKRSLANLVLYYNP